jgi:ATP-dependent DNA helicase PIF1
MNPEQQLALDDVLAGRNVFITGGAGVGKSFLVNEIVSACKKTIGVCAMTGCAALLINGTTLHSYLAIGLGKDTPQKLALTVRKYPPVMARIIDTDILLIDEVSMLSDELFEKIDEFLQCVKRSKKLFGGTQLVLVGDPFQLCPVVGSYCFTSPVWNKCNFATHRLTTNMRQQGDPFFKEILDRVRWGGCNQEDLTILKKLRDTQFPDGIQPTRLYSKNVSVDAINTQELLDLGAAIVDFPMVARDDADKKWASAHRIPEKVRLCVGAQVMCTKNIPDLGLANGSRGVITAIDSTGVSFKKLSGAVVRVPVVVAPETTLTYLPIKLAWAITIHSAQGMTIDALEVDLGEDIFAFGQAYTGLSRGTSLSSVRIANVLPSSFVTSSTVKNFFQINCK